MKATSPHNVTRSPFTDEEFSRLPAPTKEWWFRIFALMHQSNAPLDLARRAIEEAERQTAEE